MVDLASAHVKALSYIDNHPNNNFDVFNIGTGNGFTVLEIIQAFERVNQLKLNFSIGERRAGDVEKVWADNSKAETVLGWKANIGLDEMVRSAWAWQQQLQ